VESKKEPKDDEDRKNRGEEKELLEKKDENYSHLEFRIGELEEEVEVQRESFDQFDKEIKGVKKGLEKSITNSTKVTIPLGFLHL
jgi:hypothetical protein